MKGKRGQLSVTHSGRREKRRTKRDASEELSHCSSRHSIYVEADTALTRRIQRLRKCWRLRRIIGDGQEERERHRQRCPSDSIHSRVQSNRSVICCRSILFTSSAQPAESVEHPDARKREIRVRGRAGRGEVGRGSYPGPFQRKKSERSVK